MSINRVQQTMCLVTPSIDEGPSHEKLLKMLGAARKNGKNTQQHHSHHQVGPVMGCFSRLSCHTPSQVTTKARAAGKEGLQASSVPYICRISVESPNLRASPAKRKN
jgi:hypothetical protein